MKNAEVKKTVAAAGKEVKPAEKPAAKAAEPAKKAEPAPAAKTAAVKAVEPAKKAEEPAKKTRGRKPGSKNKTAPKTKLVFQYYGQEFDPETITKKVQKAAAKKADKIKKLDVYVNIEENAVYYVVDGNASDDYRIQL